MTTLLLLLLFQTSASENDAASERLTRLETRLEYFSESLHRIEAKVDDLGDDLTAVAKTPAEEPWLSPTHGVVGLFMALIALDKAGYYIRRYKDEKRNGNGN